MDAVASRRTDRAGVEIKKGILRGQIGQKNREVYGNIAAWAVLGILGIMMILPFLWMVSTSLKAPDEVFAFPPTFIPRKFMWVNYIDALRRLPFGRFLFNSYYIAATVTAGQIFFCSLGGYAFARLRFPGRDKLFIFYLATMMIPVPVNIIPLYIIARELGWINTHWALIVPAVTSAWGTFLMRQFMLTLPKDLEDSARIDGCTYFGIYWRIIMPVSKPVIATLAIFTFVGAYNDFMWPLIALSSVELKTIPLGLAMFIARQAIKTPWHLLMAASTVSIVPLLIVFILGQKHYVRGIVTTGLKG